LSLEEGFCLHYIEISDLYAMFVVMLLFMKTTFGRCKIILLLIQNRMKIFGKQLHLDDKAETVCKIYQQL